MANILVLADEQPFVSCSTQYAIANLDPLVRRDMRKVR